MMFLLSPALRDVLLTSMAQYSLFVLKVLLITKQTDKQTNFHADRHFNCVLSGLLYLPLTGHVQAQLDES